MRKWLIILILFELPLAAQDFIQRQGKKLFLHGNEIHLRGIAFGNLVWDNTQIPQNHHTEKDFERVHNLGMNAVRFYMNYKTLEEDTQPFQYKQTGWDWIDQNIQWAKNNGIYLILNMHVPQGGFQSQCAGSALWSNSLNQDRLSSLWKAIAERYKNESQIAGFDLVNEPTPTGTIQKWSTLAQRIIDSIRSADTNHLIITERAIALDCNYGYADINNNYPQLTENNLMYTVHLYDPHEYTHQLMAWAGTGDGGKYPDENKISPPADATYATGHYANPTAPPGNSTWTYYEGTPYTVTHDSLIMGRIVFVSSKTETGKIYYDDIKLDEFDNSGNYIRTVYEINFTGGIFWWWSANNDGNHSISTSGHNDTYSIVVSGTSGSASVICADQTFKVYKNRKYKISGWMKGENLPVGSNAAITTEFYYSPSRAKVGVRNYESLVTKITSYAKYIEDKGFPVYFGEFGAGRPCFSNNKGGEKWVSDAMHIFDSLGYHFTYHSYKESSFGLYDGWAGPLDTTTVNVPLQNVFLSYFGLTTDVKRENSERTIFLPAYPNPVGDVLKIRSKEHIDKVEILDLSGRLLLSSSDLSLNVKELQKGTYLIRLHYKGAIHASRFIKE